MAVVLQVQRQVVRNMALAWRLQPPTAGSLTHLVGVAHLIVEIRNICVANNASSM